MFNSLQARMIRTAISPRLATRIFSNMRSSRPELKESLTEFDRFGVFDHDLGNHAFGFGFNLIHDFHRFDNANNGFRVHLSPYLNIRSRFGGRSAVERPDHGRFYFQFGSGRGGLGWRGSRKSTRRGLNIG